MLLRKYNKILISFFLSSTIFINSNAYSADIKSSTYGISDLALIASASTFAGLSGLLIWALNKNNNSSQNLPDGTLLSYQKKTTYSKNDLSALCPTFFCPSGDNQNCNTYMASMSRDCGYSCNKQFANNLLGVDNYSITYTGQVLNIGALDTSTQKTLSGSVLIPQGCTIKGVILYFHGATSSKVAYGPTVNYKTNDIPFATYYASNGYIVVMPDYIGYGANIKDAHPYTMYPKPNVLSGTVMLKATRQLLNKLHIPNINYNLYINGFSEGGTFALWTSYMLQNNMADLNDTQMTLKLTVPISGAYDYNGVELPFLKDNVTQQSAPYNINNLAYTYNIKPAIISEILFAFFHYNNLDCSTQMNSGFCTLNNIPNDGYTVSTLFGSKNDLSDDNVNNYLFSQATTMPAAYSEYTNSVNSFINPTQTFLDTVKAASLVKWVTTSPITFLCLNYDSVVSSLNSYNAYTGLLEAGSNPSLVNIITLTNSDYPYIPTVQPTYGTTTIDHNYPFALFILSLSQFNSN